jgi:HD-GYP domain-containing protein (c-di-GMP phosphodiesterase class II)
MLESMEIDNEIRKSRNETIRALLEALDLNAPGERLHAERVAVYAVATGAELGLSEEELLRLRYSALLHDVGKTKLDGGLLSKVGKLSEAELDVLRRHAEYSVRLVESYDFLVPAIPGIRSHHERWNGMGYPDGLVGEEIPTAAQIIGMVEAFDVMMNGAAWKSSTTREIALEEIEDSAGIEWNPEVVEAFLKVERIIQPIGSD